MKTGNTKSGPGGKAHAMLATPWEDAERAATGLLQYSDPLRATHRNDAPAVATMVADFGAVQVVYASGGKSVVFRTPLDKAEVLRLLRGEHTGSVFRWLRRIALTGGAIRKLGKPVEIPWFIVRKLRGGTIGPIALARYTLRPLSAMHIGVLLSALDACGKPFRLGSRQSSVIARFLHRYHFITKVDGADDMYRLTEKGYTRAVFERDRAAMER